MYLIRLVLQMLERFLEWLLAFFWNLMSTLEHVVNFWVPPDSNTPDSYPASLYFLKQQQKLDDETLDILIEERQQIWATTSANFKTERCCFVCEKQGAQTKATYECALCARPLCLEHIERYIAPSLSRLASQTSGFYCLDCLPTKGRTRHKRSDHSSHVER
jgi:hypothetical protein